MYTAGARAGRGQLVINCPRPSSQKGQYIIYMCTPTTAQE